MNKGEHRSVVIERRSNNLLEATSDFSVGIETKEEALKALTEAFYGVSVMFWDLATKYVEVDKKYSDYTTAYIAVIETFKKKATEYVKIFEAQA